MNYQENKQQGVSGMQKKSFAENLNTGLARKLLASLTKSLSIGVAGVMMTASLAQANVLGVDTQNFNPVTNGLDFVTVHSSETLKPGLLNLGLFLNFAKNTLVVARSQGNLNIGDESKDSLLSSDFNVGLGLTKDWDVGVSFPVVLSQEFDDDLAAVNFAQKGMTEIRVNTKYRLYGDDSGGLAVIGSANFNRIENNPFVGEGAGPTYNLELAVDTTLKNKIGLGFNIGYRFRDEGTAIAAFPFAPFKDQWIASVAANYLLEDQDTKLIAEIFGSVPTEEVLFDSKRGQSSAELLLGAKHDINADLAWHVGLGTELLNGSASPSFRVYTGINWVLGPLWDTDEDEIVTEGTPVRRIVINDDVFFAFDSDQLRPSAIAVIQEISGQLKDADITKVTVEGHTDSIGSNEYNWGLSNRRAKRVRDALIAEGVSESVLESAGFGETRPVADNGNFQGRARNRRVEFQIER